MTIPIIVFLALLVLLVLLLLWAASPPKNAPLSPDQAFETLSAERHYARLPQILQSLREDDSEFLRARGHSKLVNVVRTQRKRIALRYLNDLQHEFQVLVECSRILATVTPELAASSELQRFRQNLKFAWNCRYLSWRLRLGLEPWDVFGTLSDMSGTLTLQLEAAAARIGERAFRATDPRLFPEDRGGNSH